MLEIRTYSGQTQLCMYNELGGTEKTKSDEDKIIPMTLEINTMTEKQFINNKFFSVIKNFFSFIQNLSQINNDKINGSVTKISDLKKRELLLMDVITAMHPKITETIIPNFLFLIDNKSHIIVKQ